MKNRALPFINRANEFQRIFGLRLGDYLNPIFGFDICKFDEDIKTPDNISTKDFILSKFGDNAVKFIEQLIKA